MSALPIVPGVTPAGLPLAATQSHAAYRITVPRDARLELARGWLWLGLAALIGSGLFSVLLVLSRTPGVNRLLPVADFFHVALVVHVDLSVLVWFIALAGMLWSLNGSSRRMGWGWLALALAAGGALSMALSPFLGGGEAIMANYIPVITTPPFILGLLVFGAGVALLVLRSLVTAPRLGFEFDGRGALRFGLNAAAVATAVALLAFGWSWMVLPGALGGRAYYECGGRIPLSPRVTLLMFALALASVFVTPYAYVAHDIASVEHRALLTWAMRLGGGVAIVPVALAVVFALATAPAADATTRPLRAALLSSVLLFAAGGVIGIFIAGSNVRIPAHYHGCIVGVTLALMGLVYRMLPALGYRAPQGRLAVSQPWLYAGGQLMHIAGLVWSGGYGVQRKVAGAEQVLRTPAEIAGMGLMGLGGAIAIVGGLLFVVVVLRAMRGTIIAPDALPAAQ